jgi:hypothetical protein
VDRSCNNLVVSSKHLASCAISRRNKSENTHCVNILHSKRRNPRVAIDPGALSSKDKMTVWCYIHSNTCDNFEAKVDGILCCSNSFNMGSNRFSQSKYVFTYIAKHRRMEITEHTSVGRKLNSVQTICHHGKLGILRKKGPKYFLKDLVYHYR